MRSFLSLRRTRLALALGAALLTLTGPAGSAVVVTGPYGTDPFNPGSLSGPNLILPGTRLWLGTGGNASFEAVAGAVVELAQFSLAQQNSVSTALLDGPGTVMRLRSDGNGNRFEVGNAGQGSFIVSGGALLDGRADAAACLTGNRWCNNFIGNAAGSTGSFVVTGAGSEARFLSGFLVGNINVNGGFGTAGATTTGTVQVLAGGLLRTEGLTAGMSWSGPNANGAERSVTNVLVQGAGSRWLVEANTLNGNEALAEFANGTRASNSTEVSNGGSLKVVGTAGQNYGLRISQAGGTASVLVSGAGSVFGLEGDADRGYLHIAEWGQGGGPQGSGRLDVREGGTVLGGRWNQIGLGGNGTLSAQGAGTVVDMARGELTVANSGTGRLEVLDGATLRARELVVGALWFDPNTPRPAGNGSVLLDGAASLLSLGAVDGHRLIVGSWGQGAMTVSGGALLDAASDAAACANRWCGALVGQSPGSTGLLRVTGASSQASFLGDFNVAFLDVNRPATDGWTHGDLGGISRGRVEVLDGGVLRTERVTLGGWQRPAATGGERSFAEVLVNGAGSVWEISGSALAGNGAGLNVGMNRNADAQITLSGGGALHLIAPAGQAANLDLAMGNSVLRVDGAGSRLRIDSDRESRLVIGNAAGGTALLQVSNAGAVSQGGGGWSYLNIGELNASGRIEIVSGGSMSGARHVNVGSGGTGQLLIDGTGSQLSTLRTAASEGQLNVGVQGQGRLDIRAAGAALVSVLQVGNGFGRESRGAVVIDGAGSKVELDGVDWHRLSISNGSVTVSGGALLDGAVNAASCVGYWCGAFIANNAGDTGSLTVTGSGSQARFLDTAYIGQAGATAPPDTPYTIGNPGGTTTAGLSVLAGARLDTAQVRVATGPVGPAVTGTEVVNARLRIDGAGSLWQVNAASNGSGASFLSGLGSAANTFSDLQISNGGELRLVATATTNAQLQLGQNGGVHRMSISGAGSRLSYQDTINAGLWVGRNGSVATLRIDNGGAIAGVNRVQVGNAGGIGNLALSGASSRIQHGASFADLFIGRGGIGVVDVSAGAQWQMHADNIGRITVGDNSGAATSAGQGTLYVRGTGSLLSLRSGLAGNAATANPTLVMGWSSTGNAVVNGGAALRIEGLAPADPALFLEGAGLVVAKGWGAPSKATLEVSGAGSRVETLGSNNFITVATGPQASGQMSVNNGAVVQTTLMGIGDWGASGAVQVNNATLRLSEAWRSGTTIGASLAVGNGAGSSGSLSLKNGAQVIVENSGSELTNLSLGGLAFNPGGTGLLDASGGSSVSVSGAGGSQFVIGLTAGSVGVARFSGGSSLSAGYVGVGALNGADTGGVGTLIVNDSSSLTATTLEVGAKGYVGGTGTINANVVNRGVFSPGNSPGTLTVNGSFSAGAGSRVVLEVQSDGAGGFVTDHLLFGSAAGVQLSGLAIEFKFLGGTDPNAFLASGGFNVDSFLTAGGAALPDAAFGGVQFSASAAAYTISNFSYTASGGAVFQAQAVPEPGTWLLFAAGLGLGGWLQRRRATR